MILGLVIWLTNQGASFCFSSPFFRNVLCTVLVQGYGSTETSGVATCQDKETFETDSVGYPPANGSILLESWEEGGYDVTDPEGPSGEILLSGPFVAEGYYQCPEENAAFQKSTEDASSRWVAFESAALLL